ncbi:MAG: hypothetical protein R3B40_04845 [Polyangiales bacterium]
MGGIVRVLSNALGVVPAAVVGMVAGLWLAGCSPEIGDKCSISTDCSFNGDRICDTAQPGGYCTVQGCDPDSCPNGAVCVEWRFEPSRTTATYCMERCRSSCGRRGYECVADDDPRLESNGGPLARVTDLGSRRDAKFCAAVSDTAATSMSLAPTQSVMPDAAVPSP